MSLKIYNTLTKIKEEFKPRDPKKVTLYVCGPTVYNFLHVGNFRGPVFFNLVRQWLEKKGFPVTYALNFTDIDDKILARADAEKVTVSEISEKYIAEYKTDFESLGLRVHDLNPKVTEYLESIEKMIQVLIENKKAYEVSGDVYFQVDQSKDYGKLSGRNVEDLIAGTRIEIQESKKAPADFALWKKAKPNEASWPSQWGKGRPGWHIECSAMIEKIFDGTVDIHGGGLDLVFPHHENELAQSEAAQPNKKFVGTWMHVNMLNFGGQKMSKSVGNIVSLREFASLYPSELYKWLILSSHYRSVLDFGDQSIERAISSLARIYSSLALATRFLSESVVVTDLDLKLAKQDLNLSGATLKVDQSLDDDFNTPEVWAQVFDLVRTLNTRLKYGAKVTVQTKALAQVFVNWVKDVGLLMSLFQQPPAQFLIDLDDLLLKKKDLLRADVDQIVKDRAQARSSKDFAKSDELRKKLETLEISVMDLPTGSYWEVKK